MTIQQQIPCKPYIAQFIRYHLRADENGHVSIQGRGPLRTLIRGFLTGKRDAVQDSRVGNPAVLTGTVTVLIPRVVA